jgi:hypothetical protein
MQARLVPRETGLWSIMSGWFGRLCQLSKYEVGGAGLGGFWGQKGVSETMNSSAQAEVGICTVSLLNGATVSCFLQGSNYLL